MTSDGISNADWRAVKRIAATIANATARDDMRGAADGTSRLLSLLERLEHKYGQKASLLATEADYLDSNRERIKLLVQAYKIALNDWDKLNIVLICSSLAEIYLEKKGRLAEVKKWLARLEHAVGAFPDDEEQRILSRLKRELLVKRRKEAKLKDTRGR
jgi:hypothetical protein